MSGKIIRSMIVVLLALVLTLNATTVLVSTTTAQSTNAPLAMERGTTGS